MSVQQVKFFSGLEAHRFARSDAHLSAGAGIAPDSGLPGLDRENTEAAQFDPLAGDKGLLHAFKDGVHGRFSLGARQPGTLNNPLNKVLLDH